MKIMILKTCKLLCLASLLIACNEKSETDAPVSVVDKEQIKKEIQAREDSFAAVINSGEERAIGYYGDDAKSFYPNRAPLVGKEAIVDFLKTNRPKNAEKISFTTNEIFVGGDGTYVLEIGSYKIVDSTNTPLNTGNYMSLFEKRNGRYVAIRDMSTSDMPME